MKVISGKYSGRILRSSENARPTLARVKTSLFSIISEYINSNSVVLDLFAGSGALGIECLSRGTKLTYFIDNDKKSIKVLEYNLRNVDDKFYKIKNSEYNDALRDFAKSNKKFDIIFIDPPYKTNFGEVAIDLIFRFNLLSDNGIIVFESSSSKLLQDFPNDSIIVKEKDYGTAKIYILQRKDI